jgi:hypothetical protein
MGSMKQYLASQKVSRTPIRFPHIRWNCETTPGEPDKKRVNIVIVGREPRKSMEEILTQLRNVSYVEPVGPSFSGLVKDSQMPFLFERYDTGVDPAMQVNWTQFSKRVKRDPKLVEKRGHPDNLVAYVSKIYTGF